MSPDRQPDLRTSDWRFPPEIDRLWDALTRRGMHYDRESMERDEPALVDRHRASLALALGEGSWVPQSAAEALARAVSASLTHGEQSPLADALKAYLHDYPWGDL